MQSFFKPTPKPSAKPGVESSAAAAATRSPLRERNPSSPAKPSAAKASAAKASSKSSVPSASNPKHTSNLAKERAADEETPPSDETAEDALWFGWCTALSKLESSRFYYRGVTRGETWVASYAAGAGKRHPSHTAPLSRPPPYPPQ